MRRRDQQGWVEESVRLRDLRRPVRMQTIGHVFVSTRESVGAVLSRPSKRRDRACLTARTEGATPTSARKAGSDISPCF